MLKPKARSCWLRWSAVFGFRFRVTGSGFRVYKLSSLGLGFGVWV